jgi:hypothetical protein
MEYHGMGRSSSPQKVEKAVETLRFTKSKEEQDLNKKKKSIA